MSRTRVLIVAALMTFVVGTSALPANAGQRRQMIRAINYVRGWSHRQRVRFSPSLSGGAAAWARSLVRRDLVAHSARAIARGDGEIIEWHTGRRARVNRTVVEWWHSLEHRRVMLAGDYRRAGAGRATGWMGGRRCTIWVVRFAH